MITRRQLSLTLLATPWIVSLGRFGFAEENGDTETKEVELEIPEELNTSQLIYLTPIKSDGEESKCRAEIWFVYIDEKIYVATPPDAWRTKAIEKGLTETRIWVGEFGNWKNAKDKYREAPELMAEGEVVEDAEKHEELLTAFGEKYVEEWKSWGPRFKRELDNGKRVILQYTPKP